MFVLSETGGEGDFRKGDRMGFRRVGGKEGGSFLERGGGGIVPTSGGGESAEREEGNGVEEEHCVKVWIWLRSVSRRYSLCEWHGREDVRKNVKCEGEEGKSSRREK